MSNAAFFFLFFSFHPFAYLFLCQGQSHNQVRASCRTTSRKGGGPYKWRRGSISKLHATLAFHPFSNRCRLSKRWANCESTKIGRLYFKALCWWTCSSICISTRGKKKRKKDCNLTSLCGWGICEAYIEVVSFTSETHSPPHPWVRQTFLKHKNWPLRHKHTNKIHHLLLSKCCPLRYRRSLQKIDIAKMKCPIVTHKSFKTA